MDALIAWVLWFIGHGFRLLAYAFGGFAFYRTFLGRSQAARELGIGRITLTQRPYFLAALWAMPLAYFLIGYEFLSLSHHFR
jgi:hypothetical protein